MLTYELNIDRDGDDIVLSQIANGEVNTINLTSSMIDMVCNKLQSLKNTEQSEHLSERESSAKEKEFPSFDTMQCVDDGDKVIVLTEELLCAGMTGGIGINKEQQKVLGINFLKSGWKKELIGRAIPVKDYELFVSLKGATSK